MSRELREELEMDVIVNPEDYFDKIHYVYPDFSINLYFFKVAVNNPRFVMKEHADFKWLLSKDLLSVEWASADKDIIEKLING